MKKIISTVLLCVLLVSSVFTLASCNMISGTYEGEVNLVITTYKLSYEFKGDKVTITSKLGSISTEANATYKIGEKENGDKTITFTYGDGEKADGAAEGGVALSFNQGSDNDGKYIEIAGIRYYKAD